MTSSMISTDAKEEDNIPDEISVARKSFLSHKTWTTEKKLSLERLIHLLKTHKYHELTGSYQSYSLGPIGDSFLYNVPVSQRGHLRAFREKTVRIVCAGRKGISTRVFFVGEVTR